MKILLKTIAFTILFLQFLCVTRAERYDECEGIENETFVSSSDSCQMYIYCDGEDSISGACDDGEYFDGETCDDAENVYCPFDEVDVPEESTTTTTTTSTPSSTSTTNAIEPITVPPVVRDRCPNVDDPQQIVLMTNAQSCTEYYLCYHGQAIEMQCTDNLHFNMHTAKCDFPENAQCMLDRPDATKCLPHITDFFPHPEKCNYFYYCIKGFLTLQQCPFYYGWDVERRACVQMTQAKCFSGAKKI